MTIFDASYQGEAGTPINHGKRWDDNQERMLREGFTQGASLRLMCIRMGRAPSSILARLCFMHLLTLDESTGEYRITNPTPDPVMLTDDLEVNPSAMIAAARLLNSFNQPTENTMPAIATIEQRTLINGTNAADMSDKEIFKTIAKLESEVRVLEAVNTKPKKLVAAIAALQADIEAIVAYVDERP